MNMEEINVKAILVEIEDIGKENKDLWNDLVNFVKGASVETNANKYDVGDEVHFFVDTATKYVVTKVINKRGSYEYTLKRIGDEDSANITYLVKENEIEK